MSMCLSICLSAVTENPQHLRNQSICYKAYLLISQISDLLDLWSLWSLRSLRSLISQLRSIWSVRCLFSQIFDLLNLESLILHLSETWDLKSGLKYYLYYHVSLQMTFLTTHSNNNWLVKKSKAKCNSKKVRFYTKRLYLIPKLKQLRSHLLSILVLLWKSLCLASACYGLEYKNVCFT